MSSNMFGMINNPEGKNQYSNNSSTKPAAMPVQGGLSKEYIEAKKKEYLELKEKTDKAFAKAVSRGASEAGPIAKVAGTAGSLVGMVGSTAHNLATEGKLPTFEKFRNATVLGDAVGIELFSSRSTLAKIEKTKEYTDWKKAESAQKVAQDNYLKALK
jgi:hypothetical protein